MPRLPTFDPIEYLTLRRFPINLDASSSPLADPEAIKRFEEQSERREAFGRELRAKSADEIKELVNIEQQKDADQKRRQQEAEEAARFSIGLNATQIMNIGVERRIGL